MDWAGRDERDEAQGTSTVPVKGPFAASDGLGTYLMVLSVALALVLLMDPSERGWGTEVSPALKYTPSLVAISALPWLSFRVLPRRAPFALLLLALGTAAVLGGAMYTVLASGLAVSDSFMGRGLGMLVMFPAYLVARREQTRRVVVEWTWRLGILGSLGVVAGLTTWQVAGWHFVDRPHIYHEEIFLPAAAALSMSALGAIVHPIRAGLLVTFLAAGIVSFKNTGFLTTALAGAAITAVVWRNPSRTGIGRLARRASVCLALFVVLASGAAVAATMGEALPDGTPELRLVTYPARLASFMASPIYGQFFTGSPFFELGERVVQSHSDFLDVLAYGGLVGFLLVIVPLAQVVLMATSRITTSIARHDAASTFVLSLAPFILLEALVNPVWHQPEIMVLFWVSVAFALGDRDGQPGGARYASSRAQ